MFNFQPVKSATVTACIIGANLALSIVVDIKPSQAANLTIPLSLDNFILEGNAEIVPTSSTTPFFDSEVISIQGSGSATSSPSPFFPVIRIKQTVLNFNYAFSGIGTLDLFLNNASTGETTFIDSLGESQGGIADFDLTSFITIPGSYSVTHELTGGGSAQFNNFTVVTRDIPEPSAMLGLISFGMVAFTIKKKRELSSL